MERNTIRNTALAVVVALSAILTYQVYWLVGQYKAKRVRLKADIAEAMRLADLQEMDRRIRLFKKSGGVNEDREIELSLAYQTYKANGDGKKSSVDNRTYLGQSITNENSTLKSYLRSSKDISRLGLFMQQGLHTGLDGLVDIDVPYYDRCLTKELAKLGIDGPHQLLYLYSHKHAYDEPAQTDTLKMIGGKVAGSKYGETEKYDLEIDYVIPSSYQLILPSTQWTVVRQMGGIIIASLLLSVLLGFVFLWLIHIIRRQRRIDKLKTDFTNNMTHQLKTPIAIAYAANDALLNYGLDDDKEKRKQYLQASLEQLRKLTGLVEQILSFKSKYYNE